MLCNVGGTERGIRVIVGAGLLGAAWLMNLPSWGIAMISVIGGIALVTGAVGYCPAWSVLGVKSCQPKVAVTR